MATDDEMDALLAEVAATPAVHAADGASLQIDLLVGRTLGRFVVKERLGKGGMGVVYRAHDAQLSRDVAIKVLADDDARDPARRARFLREARAAAGLTHPGVAAIHDVGFDDELQIAYIAMELVDGHDLRRALANGALAIAQVEKLALQIAKALAKAHAAGIVHRDLKPENVMLTTEGDAKILDFGLAKHIERTQDGRNPPHTPHTPHAPGATTREGTIVGTPGYMAPEQVLGRAVDARADVFAFGVLVHEMLSGKAPFVADTPMATALAVTRDAPPQLTRSDVPQALARIVARCMEKEPAARFADARAVVDALAPGAAMLLSGPITAPVAASTSSAVSATIATPRVDSARLSPRRTRVVAIASAIVLVALAVAVGLATHKPVHRRAPTDEPMSLTSIPIVSDDATIQALFRSAVLAFYDGDRLAWLRSAQQVTARDPDNSAAWVLVGLGGGGGVSAVERIRRAERKHPSPPALTDAMATFERMAAAGVKMPEVAERELDAYAESWPDEYYAQLVLLRLAMGPPDFKIRAARRLQQLDDGPPVVAQMLSESLRSVERADEANEAIDKGLAKSPEHPLLLMERARLWRGAGKLDDARALVEALAQRFPTDAPVRALLLDFAIAQGDDEGRRRHFDALRSGAFPAPEVATACVPYGLELLARVGRIGESEAALNVAAESARAAQLYTFETGVRAAQIDFFAAATAWDRVAPLEAEIDRLLAAPELPVATRKSAIFSRLRGELRRRVFTGDIDGAEVVMARLERLDETYFSAPRDKMVALERALIAAARGRGDEARSLVAHGSFRDAYKADDAYAPIPDVLWRVRIAILLHDDDAIVKEGRALLTMLPACTSLIGDDRMMCRIWAAQILTDAADAAHRRRDDVTAASFLDAYDTVWRAGTDAPAALKAAELRTALAH